MTFGAPRMPEPGDVLLGRFRVDSVIGEGGMGLVFRATILSNGGPVAIKVLSPESMVHAEAIARFINEARATTQLKSAHVVKLFDAGTLDGGLPFIVMELLEGNDLGQLLEQRKNLPVKEAVDYVIQAGEGIAEAHSRNIVHRDLKPSNLFLTNARGTPHVKVLDFGISKVISSGPQNVQLTTTGTFLGSPNYMSPEQLKNAKDVDARADIWSLGVILYELIGGRAPFDSGAFGEIFVKVLNGEYEPLRVQKPQVPEGIDYVVNRCLRRNRDERFASLNDLVQALAPFASPEGTARAQRMARSGAGGEERRRITPNPMAGTAVMMVSASSSVATVQGGYAAAPAPALGTGRVAPAPIPVAGGPPPPRESSPGFAAPSSQPALPIAHAPTNPAQQQTIAASSIAQQNTIAAASSGNLPRLPMSSPALPLHYAPNGPVGGLANQAPQSGQGPWNAPAQQDPQRGGGPPPLIVGLGIGLVVFAIVGVVLIIIALRARGHDNHDPSKNPDPTGRSTMTTPTMSASATVTITTASAAAPSPSPSSTVADDADPASTTPAPADSASAPPRTLPPPPFAPHQPPPPSILNKRK